LTRGIVTPREHGRSLSEFVEKESTEQRNGLRGPIKKISRLSINGIEWSAAGARAKTENRSSSLIERCGGGKGGAGAVAK